jgi:DNA topoisomerase-3
LFKISFEFGEKKLNEKQVYSLIQKKKTPVIKGFQINNKKVNGNLILTKEFTIELKEEIEKTTSLGSIVENAINSETKKSVTSIIMSLQQTCPKCNQGILIQGKTAWGCNRFKEGCDYRISFV